MQKITNDLKFTSTGLLEFMVLKTLSERSHSRDELILGLKNAGFKVSIGTISPLLSGLRAQEHIQKGYEESEAGPGMKTYDLTEKGRGRLADLRSDWKRLNDTIARLGKGLGKH